MEIRVSSVIEEQIKRVRGTGLINMFDAVGVAILADQMGYEELSDFIAEDRNRYIRMGLEGYVVTDKVCQCIEIETGVNAAEYADTTVEPIDSIRDRWKSSVEGAEQPFEVFAKDWYAAAAEYRRTSPDAYKPDPDCPYCGGSGVTEAVEWQENIPR